MTKRKYQEFSFCFRSGKMELVFVFISKTSLCSSPQMLSAFKKNKQEASLNTLELAINTVTTKRL